MPFFVVHEHHARRLHFDLRLEMEGVLKSWAIPKGPSLNPREKRLAIMVEDHPIEYGDFEGIIPEGMYGAGAVVIWDKGVFDIKEGSINKGRLTIVFYGKKLKGAFDLIRFRRTLVRDNEWLLIKKADEYADYSFKLKTVLKEEK
ncbi:MAG: DNA polymerase ligase N-terminal domain-containing protein [Thermodesulfovibrionales bacterium]